MVNVTIYSIHGSYGFEIGGKMVGKIGHGLEPVGTDDAKAHCLRRNTRACTHMSQ
jgi:hypothetical protein